MLTGIFPPFVISGIAVAEDIRPVVRTSQRIGAPTPAAVRTRITPILLPVAHPSGPESVRRSAR